MRLYKHALPQRSHMLPIDQLVFQRSFCSGPLYFQQPLQIAVTYICWCLQALLCDSNTILISFGRSWSGTQGLKGQPW